MSGDLSITTLDAFMLNWLWSQNIDRLFTACDISFVSTELESSFEREISPTGSEKHFVLIINSSASR